ncbi:MAG: nitrate reductase, partial [Mailhella sp.]
MSIFFYCLAYVAVIAFVAVALMRIIGYLKKPQHLRWELYPVPHEEPERAEYGGSYLEKTDWWKDKYRTCMVGTLKGFLIEALFLKAVWEHNRTLW